MTSYQTDASMAPAIAVQCRVEWTDTDASGHYHHGTVIRWVEIAEAALFRDLGAAELFSHIPRVHYEARYLSPAWFGDVVDVGLWVDRVGESSLTMTFDARKGDVEVARGTQTIVHVSPATRRPHPWPDTLRQLLHEASSGASDEITADVSSTWSE